MAFHPCSSRAVRAAADDREAAAAEARALALSVGILAAGAAAGSAAVALMADRIGTSLPAEEHVAALAWVWATVAAVLAVRTAVQLEDAYLTSRDTPGELTAMLLLAMVWWFVALVVSTAAFEMRNRRLTIGGGAIETMHVRLAAAAVAVPAAAVAALGLHLARSGGPLQAGQC